MNMIKRNTILFLTILAFFMVSAPAMAKRKVPKAAPSGGSNAPHVPGKRSEGDFIIEKRGDGSTVKYKKKTAYDFEGANIDGMYNKPSGSYISNIKDVKAKSIIRIRENFDAEVVDSQRLLK